MNQNGSLEMQWPSKRIPPGGMLHPRRVVYSPETHKMLRVLMDEAKLTMLMRKKLDWCLRSGSSLSDVSSKDEQRTKSCKNSVTIRPRTSRRRSYSLIKNSGDLERERYRPTRRAEDREIVKKRLQDIMEFGRETEIVTFKKDDKRIAKKTKTIPSKIDILYDLLSQIQDREEWLQEMDSLGEGEKHREVINSQIAERIRQIEALKITLEDEEKKDDSEKCIYSTRSESSVRDDKFEKLRKNSHKEKIASNKIADDKFEKSIEKNCGDNMEFVRKIDKTENKSLKNCNKEKTLSEKEFGEMFNSNNPVIYSPKGVTKNNMRGFSIEGSSCLLSGTSENSRKSHKAHSTASKSKVRK